MRKTALAAAISAVVAATPASAAVIDFAALPGTNLSPLGSYVEDGFKVENISNFQVLTDFGNPARSIGAPGILNGTDGTGSFRLSAASGGTFSFASFDFYPGSLQDLVDYEIIGSLNGATVFDVSGSETGFFIRTIAPGTAGMEVDTLTFSFLGRLVTYMVDNIVVTQIETDVPEPAMALILAIGTGGLAALRRRQRRE